MLKSLSVFAMLLGLGFFAVGCEPAADTETTTDPAADTGAAGDMPAEDAAADPGTDDPAADPAAP